MPNFASKKSKKLKVMKQVKSRKEKNSAKKSVSNSSSSVPKKPPKVVKKLERKIKKKTSKTYISSNPSAIKNKQKRMEILDIKNFEVKRAKAKERKSRQQERSITNEQPKIMPTTIDDKRELDETYIFEENDEILNEEGIDEFSSYFLDQDKEPKIFMTTSEKPNKKIYEFLKQFKAIVPNCHYYPRNSFSIQDIAEAAEKKGYTALIVFRQTKNSPAPSDMIFCSLPAGPTLTFKLSSYKPTFSIHHGARSTDHKPEIILTNFNTYVGRRVARALGSIFPQKPEFRGRRVITFLNKRDFIFFRHHRYVFGEQFDKVSLQEIGPRFTLKLLSIQKGIFDNVTGESEFQSRADMYVSRKKFYL